MLATFGSLFLQYEEGLQPCEFCWFQRICMYPLSLLLGIAAFRGDVQVAKRYFISLAMVGAMIAIYHYQLEHVPNESTSAAGARRDSVQRRALQCLRLHLRPLPVDGRVSPDHDALLVARGRRDDYEEDEDEIDLIEAGTDGDTGDDALPAPA